MSYTESCAKDRALCVTPQLSIKRHASKLRAGCLALLTLSLLLPAKASRAAESVLPITPPGSTDTDQAVLPPPGLYGAFVNSPYNSVSHGYD